MARYLVTFLPGNPIPTRTKWIDDAVGPPDANVDAGTDGVAFGSVLYDGTDLWFCVDPTTAAAVWVQINGGGAGDLEDLETDLSVSGSKTVDRDDAPNHYLVLDGNTVLDATSTTYTADLISMLLFIQQDGTGGHTLDMSAFTWTDGEPTMPSGANDLLVAPIFSVDNGVTWIGISSGSSSVGALDDLSDVTITAAASGDFLRHNGSAWADSTIQGSDIQNVGHYEVLMVPGITAPPEPILTAGEDDWLYGWVPG